jgi:intracellular septation protein
VALGVALGIAQIGWQFARKRSIETIEWLSLFLVVGSGAATLITNDPRFVMIKPSLIYAIVAVVMLKPGWMNRYLPPVAMEIVPDVVFIFGFVWSGLMFLSAALNVIVALNFSVATWASFKVALESGLTNEASKASAWVSKNLFAGLSHPKDIL